MTRLLAVLTAAALVLVSVTGASAGPTTADPAAVPTAVSVSTMPNSLAKGDSFEVAVATCRAAPGATIAVERRLAPDGEWFPVGAATLGDDGATLLDLAPRRLASFDFRVVLPGGSASRAQRVTVVSPSSRTPNVGVVAAAALPATPPQVSQAPATLLRGERFILDAAVCPPKPGAQALLQRRLAPDGAWSTVRSATLDATGTASFDMAPRGIAAWEFRAVVGTTTSRVQTVRVSVDKAPSPATAPSTSAPPGQAPAAQTVTVSNLPATLDKGSTVTYSVSTTPAASGAPLHVQKRIGAGEWFTVKKLRLDSRGTSSMTLEPIAARTYQFRASVQTGSWVTSRAQTLTVVRPSSAGDGAGNGATGSNASVAPKASRSDSSIKRYQLWNKTADRWLPRGRWVTLQGYRSRTGVPTTHIVQLNLRIRGATGGRPSHLVTGWQRADGHRVGEMTFAIPEKGGDRPYHVSHHYTFFNTGNTTAAQLFIPGSGRVKVTTEVIKAIAHPTG